jgi:uncharacterized protein
MIYTAIAAGALGTIFCLLGSAVSLTRIAGKAEGKQFERLQRAHGNAAEHMPMMLILILVAEALRAPRWVLIAAVIAAIVARLIHAAGYLIRRRHPLHFTGSTITYMIEGGLGVLVLVLGLMKL